jgi:hypothetical protein
MNAIELDLTLEQAAGRKALDQRQERLEEEQAAGRRAVEAAKAREIEKSSEPLGR